MLNQFVIVGRITKHNQIDDKHSKLKIKVMKECKNEEGLYEADIIPIELTGSIMTNVQQYCKKEDVVGVKGKITTKNNMVVLKAEKVSFLSSKNSEEEE